MSWAKGPGPDTLWSQSLGGFARELTMMIASRRRRLTPTSSRNVALCSITSSDSTTLRTPRLSETPPSTRWMYGRAVRSSRLIASCTRSRAAGEVGQIPSVHWRSRSDTTVPHVPAWLSSVIADSTTGTAEDAAAARDSGYARMSEQMRSKSPSRT
jgi:hypothetical protein